MNPFNEDNLIEQPAIRLFEELWRDGEHLEESCHINAFSEDGEKELYRGHQGEVVLVQYLKIALVKLNPDVSTEALNWAIDEIIKDRSKMSIVQANKEVYNLIKNGVKVETENEEGVREIETVKVIDFDTPENNNFLLVSQMWITGDMYKRRTDLIGFVNGLPLIFIELKAAHKNLRDAFDDNFKDYKDTIPQIFWYNQLVILSNGLDTKLGTITSGFEHFNEWKRISEEEEKTKVSLETVLRGVCEKSRLLDIIENFTLFEDTTNGVIKITAKNHQYLGVNRAIKSFEKREENNGRIGVFWHTQGGGKSYSMVFFSQKILRKYTGNYTFIVVTDRQELDRQIYKNFANTGAVLEPEESVRADSVVNLRELLKEDHRNIFTLIQKFQTTGEEKEFPVLSERSDIIVMTDEAHRSQYDILAYNMRKALPNASFIGFTGTPLIAGEEEQTKQTFGDYVSVYDFKQSVDDGATVPLFYENRIPTLTLDLDSLGEDLGTVLDTFEMDQDQEKKLEREFNKEYHFITSEERLDIIAKDTIEHFNSRGSDGKAMFVAIDRPTAVKMYNKMKAQPNCPDVAVVISSSQNEIAFFREKGLDIETHRRRMINEDLETKFKDKNDPLKIVIVCSMWLTGFDAPVVSTMYLDKPMKNHTLMQTIARANRVAKGKNNGLIVDYIGVFRNLKKALAIYGARGDDNNTPIKEKGELVKELRNTLDETRNFCNGLEIDIKEIQKAKDFEKLTLISSAIDEILTNEETKNEFISLSNHSAQLLGAILPDRQAGEFFEEVKLYRVLAERIRILTRKEIDVDDISDAIEKLLDNAIKTEGYTISDEYKPYDLSKIDFEKLRKFFEKSKHTQTEKLQQSIADKLNELIKLNPTRDRLIEAFEKLLSEYNSGSKNIEEFFEALMKFAKSLGEEEQRGTREELNEEELAIFDLLYKPELKDTEIKEIKKVAKDLLIKLKEVALTLDWRRTQQGRAGVLVAIKDVLYDELPSPYDEGLIESKTAKIFSHIYESYIGNGVSVYAK
jgi:type I restriction enzyme R subunit